MKDDVIKASKFLSYVLRHRPDAIGLNMDEHGWVEIDQILKNAIYADHKFLPKNLSRELIDEAVDKNDKNRFEVSKDGWRIRAVQGHTVEVDLELTPKYPPCKLYHGTTEQSCHLISVSGIKRMKRNYVHLSPDIDTAKKVASRRTKDIKILTIQAKKMANDGHDFYLSSNGVWLTDFVPSKYIDFESANESGS